MITLDRYLGGAAHTAVTTTVVLNFLQAKVWHLNPTVAAQVVQTPPPAPLPLGGPVALLWNAGSYPVTLKTPAGVFLVYLGVGEVAEVYLLNAAGEGIWFARKVRTYS